MNSINKPTTLYLINSYASGGAENGILALLESGFFDNTKLHLMAIHKGSGNLFETLKQNPKIHSVSYCVDSENLTPLAMIICTLSLFIRVINMSPSYLMLSLVQANLIGYFVALFFPKLKVITFLHNTRFSKEIYRKLTRLFSRRVDFYFYDTFQTANVMQSLYTASNKENWFYVPLVYVDSREIKNQYAINGTCKIISVGRLNRQKNYEQAIRAIELLKQQGFDVRYDIAGIGDLQSELQLLVEELGLQQQVRFLGYVHNWQQQVTQYDLYLMCSSYEGLSIVTIEAMAKAMPIVATDVGGIREYGVSEVNMLKTRTDKSADIATVLARLIRDMSQRQHLGQSAHETSYAQFSRDKVFSQLSMVKQKIWAFQ